MFKRLLAFVLAGALIFETPATSLAAEQIPVTEQDSTEGLEEESDGVETGQETSVEESRDSEATEKNEVGGDDKPSNNDVLSGAGKAEVQEVEESEADIDLDLTTDATLGTLSGTSAVIADDFSKLTLSATVTGYAGAATKAYLYYEYTNALEEIVKGIGAAVEGTQTDGTKTFELSAVNEKPALLANEEYNVKVCVVFADDAPNPEDVTIDDTMLNETVTAAAGGAAVSNMEFATFTVAQNASVKNMVDYTINSVQAAGDDSPISTTAAAIYYREEPNGKFNKSDVVITKGASTGNIIALVPGKSYYFVLMVGGAMKEARLDLPAEDVEITLSKSEESGDNNSIGTYDVVRTIKAEAASGSLAEAYTLEMWYKKSAAEADFAKLGSETLNADNGYKAAMNSAKWTVLTPNTSYDFEYRLMAVNADATADYIKTLSDNGVTTNHATFTVTHDTANSSHNQHKMEIALDENEYANLKANSQAIELDAYLKKTSDADSDYEDTNVDVLLEQIANYTATLTFTGLESETTYSLVLRNADGEDVLSDDTKLTFTTDAEPEDTREVKGIVVTPTSTRATIEYTTVSDVSGVYVHCYVRKVSADGEAEDSWIRKGSNYCNSGTVSRSFSISGLSPETKYEYLIGFGDDYDTSAESLINPVKAEFTTLADKRKATVVSTNTKVTEASFDVTVSNVDDDCYVQVYYRKQAANGEGAQPWSLGASEWYYASSPKHRLTIYGLTPNTAYDYTIGVTYNSYNNSVEGLINPTEGKDFTTKEDNRTITATAKATVTSVVIDYTVGGLFSETDELEFYYKEKDSETWSDVNRCYIGAPIKLTALTAGKTYEFVIGFRGWGSTAEEIKAHAGSAGAEISLVAEDRQITSTATAKVTSVVINYSVSGTIDEDDSFVGFYKPAAAGDDDWSRLYYDSNESFTMSGMAADTEYEYVLGFEDWGLNASEWISSGKAEKKTFKTLADDRKVTAVSNAKATEAVISCAISGAVSEDDEIVAYYKLKNGDDSWHQMSSKEAYSDYLYKISKLTPNTEYSYVIGFTDWDTTEDGVALAASDKAAKGDFKTTEDNSKAEVTAVESRVTKAVINYTLSGDYSSSDSLWLYYKEDAKEDVSANWSSQNLTKNVNGTTIITDLMPETKYNYKIGFGTNVDELAGVATGDFTTIADQRTLSDASAEVMTTGKYPVVKLSYLFSGNIDRQDTYIHYFYKVKAEETAETSVGWQKVSGYTEATSYIINNFSMSIYDMDWGKTYEYAVVIANSTSISSPDVVTSESMKLTGTVTIPDREAATNIRLSQEKIYLNVGNYYTDEEGYNTQTLTASLTPVTAKEDLVWSSDKPDIATVDEDGCVTAQGVGTAKITVSVQGTDIKDECDVEVADYRIGISYGGEYFETNYVSYSQNSKSIETYNLYKYENGNRQIVEDLQVTSDNELIAKWSADENKLITGTMTGTAKLTFASGNFKALLYVESLSTTQNIYVTDFEVYDKYWNDSSYKAINNGKEGFTFAYSRDLGLTYTAVLDEDALYPYDTDNEYFTWEITPAGQNIATVDEYGTVTPLKSGDVTLKITRSIDVGANEPKILTAEIPLHIVDVPNIPTEELYALVNVATTLKDIDCPAGWAWKYPDTPLVVNGNYFDYYDDYANSYDFEAVCTSGAYPSECTITVNMAKVTGVSVYGYPDAIVEVGGDAGTEDSLEINVSTGYLGAFDYSAQSKYYNGYKIDIPAVKDLTITPGAMDLNGRQSFSIKAAKAGSYTIKPVIKVGDKVLAQATYKFKAVSGTNAESVKLELVDKTKGIVTEENGKIYIDLYSENEVGGVKPADSVTTFNVKAILKDRIDAKTPGINASTTSASLSNAKLTWKSSDAKVIAVAAASDAHTAAVTVKGEGHAILTATVKDAVGRSGKLNVEIRNHAPRVDTSKVTINKAYDYTTSDGHTLAYNSAGSVEVVPVYDENIEKVRVYKGDAESSDLRVYEYDDGDDYGERYIIAPRNDKAASGDYELRVTTDMGKTYKYPIKVTVVDKAPKVTVKSNNTVNLFYTNNNPEIAVKVSGTNVDISSVTWKDKTAEAGDGFTSTWSFYDYNDKNSSYIYYGAQESIKLDNKHKPVSADIAKGTFTVKLSGYRQAYTVSGTIKYNYKKPAIVSDKASTTLAPSIGQNSGSFRLLNKDTKTHMYLNDYDVICRNKNITMNIDGYYVQYGYSGKTSGSENIELKLMSDSWREPVIVKHTIKLSKPNVLLSTPQIVLNTNEKGTAYTFVYDKNSGSRIYCDDIVYEGKDAKSVGLLTDGKLEIVKTGAGDNSYHYGVGVIQKRMEEPIAPGTYSYKITPYYKDAEGNRQALKTLILKVKVVNKAVTAKVKTKNTLDLIKVYQDDNYISLTSTFTNIGSYYTIKDIRLVGDYSDYFEFYDNGSDYGYYTGNGALYISEDAIKKLKAGQKYRLALEYTIAMLYGDTFTVTSAAFTVTPKQSVPKVIVSNNNQTLYAGGRSELSVDDESYYRLYKFSMSYTYKEGKDTYTSYYYITGIHGGLDCNKDGEADIKVAWNYWDDEFDEFDGSCYARVFMEDTAAVLTTTGAKGKTYTVPVTVELMGRDGISKDVKTTIKVTVKR